MKTLVIACLLAGVCASANAESLMTQTEQARLIQECQETIQSLPTKEIAADSVFTLTELSDPDNHLVGADVDVTSPTIPKYKHVCHFDLELSPDGHNLVVAQFFDFVKILPK